MKNSLHHIPMQAGLMTIITKQCAHFLQSMKRKNCGTSTLLVVEKIFWFFVKQAVEQWVHKGLLKPILEKYDKDVLREVIEEILRDDMSFKHTKMKLEKYKEKSI